MKRGRSARCFCNEEQCTFDTSKHTLSSGRTDTYTRTRGDATLMLTKCRKRGRAFGGWNTGGCVYMYICTPFKTSFGGVFGDWRVVSPSFRNSSLKALLKFPSNCVYTRGLNLLIFMGNCFNFTGQQGFKTSSAVCHQTKRN